MLFQYQREKSYKTELLNTQLQNYNEQLYSYMADAGSLDSLKHYIMTHMIPNLRVTIITPEGKVIFDSTDKALDEFQNHSSRKEVQDALMYGSGYAISRYSESLDGEEFFYSAKYFPSFNCPTLSLLAASVIDSSEPTEIISSAVSEYNPITLFLITGFVVVSGDLSFLIS